MKLVITCEHGGNKIPLAYSSLFEKKKTLLDSHQGWDLGILEVFEFVKLEADYYKSSSISRLLIEKNRSLHHSQLFSEITQPLKISAKQKIIEKYYLPYRNEIEQQIHNYLSKGEEVLHISLHSFTPILNGQKRNADLGFLYDPKRNAELFWVKKMIDYLDKSTNLKIRRNYPYLGTADGFTTYLRKQFSENYGGIEIEINQCLLVNNQFPLPIQKSLKSMIQKL